VSSSRPATSYQILFRLGIYPCGHVASNGAFELIDKDGGHVGKDSGSLVSNSKLDTLRNGHYYIDQAFLGAH
jgi:hypothetical protein